VPAPPVTVDSSLGEILAFIDNAEKESLKIFEVWFADLPPIENVQRRKEVNPGVDGNDIRLFIYEPVETPWSCHCVYHIHGGGMVLLTATDILYVRWRDKLAATGMAVVGVDFRNGGGSLGNYSFPAGLSDCMSGLEWTSNNRADLGHPK